ncbi:MAG: hypothetical protein FWF53_11555 [Candidatus Azobacteroides sp.]|nr:hypothetical protein [Candidatus Azobacteroides sp.]
MKINCIYTIIASIALFFSACSPEDYTLGIKDIKQSDLVEGIAFKIEHDASNPNIVYLTSLLGNQYTPLWNHPQGRSQEQKVTLKMPFAGTYVVQFGVETRGGAVYGNPVTFSIDNFYADFVNDEMWTNLTGGVGNSKTWIYDNGEYGLASDEMDYADPATVVEYNNFTTNWNPGKGYTGDDQIWGSTMTFSLNGGAYVNVHNTFSTGEEDESGTFMLNTDDHTITFTDANIMHPQSWDYQTTNWGKGLKILTLTENQLRVAVLRELVSGQAEWWMVWNYVSKEYADNYVPTNEPDPVPDIGGNGNEILTTTTTKTWTLSLESPYDWATLTGDLMNGFTGKDDYLSTGWAAYDADMIAATKFTFTSTSASGGKFVFSSYDNDDIEGAYTIDANNDIDFGQALDAVISQSDFGWISTMRLSTTAQNKLRIVKTAADVMGSITDMWLGQRSTEKDEYMVYHFILSSGGSTTDTKKAWVNAFAGKTFKPDVNWFVDWVGGPPDFSGGWTTASTFGNDFTSNGWVWDADVRAVAESASLKFEANGDKLKVTLTQIKEGVNYTASGDVTIDPDNGILNFSIPLVDYAGTVASWLGTVNDKSSTGNINDWYFVSHGGNNLSNIDTQGFWLGRFSQSTAAGDSNDEVTIFHYVLAP